jgi:hypothetical protein
VGRLGHLGSVLFVAVAEWESRRGTL